MLLIPAIDLKQGKCVRLEQGDMKKETVFSNNPIEIAERWISAGAKRLHIIDLDGAIEGSPINIKIIEQIAATYSNVALQVGGGIRDEETVQNYLDAGVKYTIIGTKAVTDPDFVSSQCAKFPGHIIVGLDAKNGKLAVAGWSKLSEYNAKDVATHFEKDGIAAVIYTDISRDGMMQGLNIPQTDLLAKSINTPVIASGGVNSIQDIKLLCEANNPGIQGVILGRSLYENAIDLAEAQKLVDKQ